MLEVGGSYATSDNSLISASYFAIKNITIGYTLPKRWLGKLDIESLRIYATFDNRSTTSPETWLTATPRRG